MTEKKFEMVFFSEVDLLFIMCKTHIGGGGPVFNLFSLIFVQMTALLHWS